MTFFHLRSATELDHEAIKDVTLAAYQEYAAMLHPMHWQLYRQSIVATLADVRPAEQIVAEQAGSVVGTVLLYPAGAVFSSPDGVSGGLSWPEIRLLAVGPEARGQGIGGALVRECVRRAKASGAAAITLHTTDMMAAAMRLYEAMGFERAPDLDHQPVPEVLVKGYRFDLAADAVTAVLPAA
jgi:predicted N-acetyltransferase YhbS